MSSFIEPSQRNCRIRFVHVEAVEAEWIRCPVYGKYTHSIRCPFNLCPVCFG
jgi:hypothetical protein